MERDDLTDLFARMDPARTVLAGPLTAEELAVRDRITGADRRTAVAARSGRRRARLILPAVGLLAAAAVTAVVISVAWPTMPAATYGPPALSITAVDASGDVLPELIERLRGSAQTTDERARSFQEWALEISEAGTAEEVTEIHAVKHELRWFEDGSATFITTAGVPLATGTGDLPGANASSTPGEVLTELTYAPGEYAPSVPDPAILAGPADVAMAMFGLTASSAAGDLAPSLPAVLSEWTLSGRNEAGLLSLVSGLNGFTFAGSTTDRIGRDALAFTMTTDAAPHRVWTLLVSPESGRIIGLEEQTVGDDPALSVPAGTVVQFIAW